MVLHPVETDKKEIEGLKPGFKIGESVSDWEASLRFLRRISPTDLQVRLATGRGLEGISAEVNDILFDEEGKYGTDCWKSELRCILSPC